MEVITTALLLAIFPVDYSAAIIPRSIGGLLASPETNVSMVTPSADETSLSVVTPYRIEWTSIQTKRGNRELCCSG